MLRREQRRFRIRRATTVILNVVVKRDDSLVVQDHLTGPPHLGGCRSYAELLLLPVDVAKAQSQQLPEADARRSQGDHDGMVTAAVMPLPLVLVPRGIENGTQLVVRKGAARLVVDSWHANATKDRGTVARGEDPPRPRATTQATSAPRTLDEPDSPIRRP